MILEHLLQASAAPALSRRRFVTMGVGGSIGLALLPAARAQQKADVPPGHEPPGVNHAVSPR